MLSRNTAFRILIVVALTIVAVLPAAAQETPGNLISVTGVGSVSVAPDKVTIEVGVETFNSEVTQAFSQSNSTLRAVTEAIKVLGIADNDIVTSNLSVYSNSRYNPSDGAEERGYSVSNTLRITVRDISQIEAVIDAAINAGANQLYGLSFSVSDPKAVESEARQLAVADARARAEELAGLVGGEVGEVVRIAEFTSGGFYNVRESAAFGFGGDGGAFVSPGQQEVIIQVEVSFRLR